LTPQHEHECTARIGEKIAEGAVMRVRHDKKAFVLSAVVASNPKALASGAAWTLVPADGEFFVRDATFEVAQAVDALTTLSTTQIGMRRSSLSSPPGRPGF
jgi:hypothetical protein